MEGPADLPSTKALCLIGEDPEALAVYLPVGGTVEVNAPFDTTDRQLIWYNPVTGAETTAEVEQSGNQVTATAPGENGDRPQDWVLYLGGS